MGEAKTKKSKIEAQMEELSPRFVELAAGMHDEGFDPVAIVEAQLTVATAQMIAVRGPERTLHALSLAGGAIAQSLKKPPAEAVN